MRHFSYVTKDTYKAALLVPKIQKEQIEKEYLSHLNIPKEDCLVLDLFIDPSRKKTKASDMKEYLKEVYPVLNEFKIEYVLVCDPEYFKIMAKVVKADVNIGYIFNKEWKIVYVPNYKAIFYDPVKVRSKIRKSLDAVNADLSGSYQEPGRGIIKDAHYPTTPDEIKTALEQILCKPALTCDIETFDLKPTRAGLASICFCWDKGSGIAFQIDYSPLFRNEIVRNFLRNFFENFTGKLIFHNIGFDATVLIYQLWMEDITDSKGLLKGLEIMMRNWDDTKIIAYLSTNSCSGNDLGLKALSQEFAGNYAQEEIGDVTRIPLKQLLEYNLTDGLSTWFVYNKFIETLIQDNQTQIYESLFKPAMKDIIQMQLTGLPLNMNRVEEVKGILTDDLNKAVHTIQSSPLVQEFTQELNQRWVIEKNKKLKTKQVTLEDAHEVFNPRSGVQMKEFLYEFLNLPVLNYTDTHQPSTDGQTLEALLNHTEDKGILEVLHAFLDFSAVDKILTAFIPSFEDAVPSKDGWHYLIGNFNLGGTVSGRLSSSKPNLQQIPATGSKYSKLIKSCFQAPEGYLLCGLDFNALEDHISALTTKDPNKLKVYTDGYDGHCLRAYSYWPERMPDITAQLKECRTKEEEVRVINSIKKTHKDLRQRSKGCTFALTYAGTKKTLEKNFGFSKEEAETIEKRYHELYKVSDEWVKDKLNQASKDGYVTVAFGLRVRTPIIRQCILGTRVTPKEAEAEKRTAGNALGQSWGLLNTRAGIEFNSLVRESEYALDIKPCCQIHDAQYFMVKDDPDVLMFCNEHLVKAVQWQDDPAIYHDKVKLGGEFSIFYPDWAHELTVPNGIKKEDLIQLAKDYLKTV